MSSPNTGNEGSNAASIFAALGDPHRLKLLEKLSDGQPRSIMLLTSDFHLSRQAISKHLRVLEGVGLVRSHRVGRESQFSFVPEPVEDIRSYLNEVCQQWDEALLRLKLLVEP